MTGGCAEKLRLGGTPSPDSDCGSSSDSDSDCGSGSSSDSDSTIRATLEPEHQDDDLDTRTRNGAGQHLFTMGPLGVEDTHARTACLHPTPLVGTAVEVSG